MPKTLIITCEVCEADITKASRAEVTWIDAFIPELTRTLYFCGHEHMYQFFDTRRPKPTEED